jgi:TetR/AcrR family transcriptional repressor of nem operon
VRRAPDKLRRYAALYDSVMRNDRLCLCGMLAAEFATLPESMQQALTEFFDANERWLARVLREGRSDGALAFRDTPADRARMLLGALEGAMLVARSYGDEKRFRTAAGQLLRDLGSATASKPRRAPRGRA